MRAFIVESQRVMLDMRTKTDPWTLLPFTCEAVPVPNLVDLSRRGIERMQEASVGHLHNPDCSRDELVTVSPAGRHDNSVR